MNHPDEFTHPPADRRAGHAPACRSAGRPRTRLPIGGQATLSLGVVLLAAGASSRMGRPKLLLPWGHDSVMGHLLAQWTHLQAEQIAVVCALGHEAISAELDRLGFAPSNRILNPEPGSGMFSSIRCAAQWTGWKPSVSHWAIVLGDQPHLRVETLRTLMDFAAAHPHKICQPSRLGRPRHPVLFPKEVFRRLADSTAENLKQFLQAVAPDRAVCELDDAGLDFDIDRPADYEQAVRLFSARE